MSLPTINATMDRVRNLELPPFQAAVDAGVKVIMAAHITFSRIKKMEGRPVTLDSYFLNDILRKEMGFNGLIISDAGPGYMLSLLALIGGSIYGIKLPVVVAFHRRQVHVVLGQAR